MKDLQRLQWMHQQQGAVLILSAFGLIMASALLMIGARSFNALQFERASASQGSVLQAQDAVVHYALTAIMQSLANGSLPCPDSDHDGLENINVGSGGGTSVDLCTTNLGWLPFRTLGLADLRDGNGARLWLAIDPNFRSLNFTSTLTGNINIDGAGAYVAVVIAPGSAEDAQVNVRYPPTLTANGDASNRVAYLEGSNADADFTQFTNSSQTSSGTDRVFGIRKESICNLVTMGYC